MKKIFISVVIFCFFTFNGFSQSVILTPDKMDQRGGSNDNIYLRNASIGAPNITTVKHGGTFTAPTATLNGNQILGIFGAGYGTSLTGARVGITFSATENWTGAANGTKMFFNTTPNGTTANTTRMTINDVGNVGIGSTTPTGKLHIEHDGTDSDPHLRLHTTAAYSRINWSTNTNSNFWTAQSYLESAIAASNYWKLEYNSNSLFYLKGDGKIGLGTSAPLAKLHILHDGSDTDPHLRLHTTGLQSRIAWSTNTNSNIWTAQSNLESATASSNYWRLEYNGDASFFNVKGNGNVGIGTSTPDAKLYVVGTQDNNGTDGTFKVSNGANDMIFDSNEIDVSGNNQLYLNNNSSGNVSIGTGGGKVGIGTNSPTAKLDIEGDIVVKKTTNTTVGTINALSRSGGSSLFMNGVGTVTVNGIAGGVDGMILYLICGNNTTLVLNHENASAASGDRITTQTAGTITITQRGGAVLIYESSTAKWRIIGFAN